MSPRIHLIAPAGELHAFFRVLDVQNAAQMVSLFQDWVGSEFQLTGNLDILNAKEDALRGGRNDDQERAEDITMALADDAVSAIVAVRGGAWFTRVLPRIDFSVLDRRTRPISVFGFSEITPLVNIVAHHPMGRGFHDMGPAFLVYGLQRHASQTLQLSDSSRPTQQEWMQGRLRGEIHDHLRSVVKLVLGGTPQSISARLVRGSMPAVVSAAFVGGNLTVLSTMVGSRYADSISPRRRWLVLEDFNDKLERFDRFLAHFTLAEYWARCEGVLLGDFHNKELDLQPAVRYLLDLHGMPPDLPVLTTKLIGHVWPMSPLPLHRTGQWKSIDANSYEWGLQA